MKIFELYWYDWDESQSWLFSHETKNKTEFKKDVHLLLSKYSNEFLEEQFIDRAECGGYIHMSDFLELISNKFSELGYKEFETIKVGFIGNAIETSTHKELKKIIGIDNFKKIINYNKNLYK